ncbi:hypothetical protein V8G54_015936 [Vigna mungo]|uniref:Zinc finger PMZ-type domain-containing protein n=1 Tax=Vigna mungo TaxID=3915 RepID=A0AAQ3NM76_VIGMU
MEEMANPRQIRPGGKFIVRLDERWCDCGMFQKFHLPYSHVLAACKHVHHNFNMYTTPRYRLDVIIKVSELCLFEGPEGGTGPLGKKLKTMKNQGVASRQREEEEEEEIGFCMEDAKPWKRRRRRVGFESFERS